MRWLLLLSLMWAQDTLRFMAYNLLSYGATPGYCNTSCKDLQLRTIIDFVRPDVIGVNEIAPSPALVRRILDSVLNIGGVSYWRSSQYANTVNSDIVNALFYDSRRLEWLGQELVTTQGGLREVYAYHLYYKEPEPIMDTLFLVVIVSHLKAGDSPSDQQTRAQAAVAIKNYIQSLPPARRRFLVEMGDHNLYGDSEAAYQTLTDVLVDPGPAGPWSNNPDYAFFHTQSTRTTALADGGVGGGLDDRFDFILFSPECTTATARARYISGTFKVIGQDGQRFKQAVNASPLPAGYPSSVINALYAMSDHLPVIADFALSVTPATSISYVPHAPRTPYTCEVSQGSVSFTGLAPCTVSVLDVWGRLLSRITLDIGEKQTMVLPTGLYLLWTEGGYSQRIFVLP